MRIIGLDLGTKTLGVAVSDATKTIANGLTTLRFEENKPEQILDELGKIIKDYDVDLIVIGLPKNMNNTLGFASERTRQFISILKDRFDVSIQEQDERLTSVTANNVLISANVKRKKRKLKVDSIAATIILQSYLDIRKEKEKWKNKTK